MTATQARREALEEAASVVMRWSTPDALRLHAGEMTAQEAKTVLAVCRAHAAAIRALGEFNHD